MARTRSQERWLRHGTDLRDPLRGAVPLGE